MDKSARQAIVAEADQSSKDAKALRNRVKDGQPSSAEADRVLARAAKLQSFIESHQVPTSMGSWTNVNARLQSVASAYGAAWSAGR
jgi:hypothetical protein